MGWPILAKEGALALSAGLSLTISMLGRSLGFSMDWGSFRSCSRKSLSYCFLPSRLIGDHWSSL